MPASKRGETKQVDWGHLNPKQLMFVKSRARYTNYGGARGGGKSHVARWKAGALALNYAGINILMIRAHFRELTENLIRPMQKWLPQELWRYNNQEHRMTFNNGSTITFGNWEDSSAENTYQGTQWDVIFIDEATQLDESAFNYLKTTLRTSTNKYPSRMYLTCNPGGVGHFWVKRLWIDREFKVDNDDPKLNENPDDFLFIPATVFDNPDLLENTPDYLAQLNTLPERIRAAHMYGDWSAMGGAYFNEFSEDLHTCPSFSIPDHWKRYRSFDYGLDMLSVKWWAIDEDGRSWCYREYDCPRLTIDKASDAIKSFSFDEEYVLTYMPPDMRKTSSDTGKTYQEVFGENGIFGVFSDNNREKGHLIMKMSLIPQPLNDPYVKSLFKEVPERLPMFMIFRDCKQLINCMKIIQADDEKPNDCAKEPHELTHSIDSARYFLVQRPLLTEKKEEPKQLSSIEEYFAEESEDKDNYYYYCGEPTKGFMEYGA